MKDPPLYVVEVNRDFYMTITTIDSERYTQTTRTVEALIEQYSLPYLIRPNPRDVLVVGAGGGVDVEAALIHGAERVDAVEIDPVIIQLGRQYNPGNLTTIRKLSFTIATRGLSLGRQRSNMMR